MVVSGFFTGIVNFVTSGRDEVSMAGWRADDIGLVLRGARLCSTGVVGRDRYGMCRVIRKSTSWYILSDIMYRFLLDMPLISENSILSISESCASVTGR